MLDKRLHSCSTLFELYSALLCKLQRKLTFNVG